MWPSLAKVQMLKHFQSSVSGSDVDDDTDSQIDFVSGSDTDDTDSQIDYDQHLRNQRREEEDEELLTRTRETSDSEADSDNEQLERDLRFMERFDEDQDLLVEKNDRLRRKRRKQKLRDGDVNYAHLGNRIREIDDEVGEQTGHNPWLRDLATREASDELTEPYLDYVSDEEMFRDDAYELAKLRDDLKRAKRVKAGSESLFDRIPDDLKMIMIQSQRTNKGICDFIQTLCNTNRKMCESLDWEAIANNLLKIPQPKPENMLWRSWVTRWCVKLSAVSPWVLSLDKNPYTEHDQEIFDNTKQEGLWRLRHTPSTPSTLFFSNTDVLNQTFGLPEVSEEYRVAFYVKDSEWMAAALRHDGRFLQYASDEMKNNREMVKLACSSHINAMSFASDEVRSDGLFIRELMKSQPDVLRHISDSVNDRQLQGLHSFVQMTRKYAQKSSSWNDDDFTAWDDEDVVNSFEVISAIEDGTTMKIYIEWYGGESAATVDLQGKILNRRRRR